MPSLFSDYRGMPGEVKILLVAWIFPSLAFGLFYIDIAYYLSAVQGISVVLVGVIWTVMGISTFVSSIPLGIAADKYGRKRFLIVGNVIASAIIAIFALTTNFVILLLAALFEGVSEGAFSASGNALLAEKAGNEKRNSVFSIFGFVQGIAFGIGSIMIPVIVVFEYFGLNNKQSHLLLYVILASLSMASTLIMLKISESKSLKKSAVIEQQFPAEDRKPKGYLRKRLGRINARMRELLPSKSKDVLVKYLLSSAVIAVGAGLIVPLMSEWMNLQYGIPDAISGPILGISNIIIGVATLGAAPLAKRFGLVKAIVLTQGISTIFMFGTPLSPDYGTASVVYSSRAFLMNMANPLQQSMIMGLVAEDERGAASGISAALWRLPNALSTSIGGYLLGEGLLAAPFFLATILYIVSILLFWFFFKNVKMPEELKQKRLES